MSNYFIKDFSLNILYDFLEKYCILENNYYNIDINIYKKYEYNNSIWPFYNNISNYYKASKRFYLNRNITYNNFLTIIRQLCKYKEITYYSKIKYDKNKYYIIYFIKKL